MSSLSSLLLLCAFLVVFLQQRADGKDIRVTMRASWGDTSLLAEACESIAANAPPVAANAAFWSCEKHMAAEIALRYRNANAGNNGGLSLTQHQEYELAKEAISKLATTQGRRLTLLNLHARRYSPLITAHAQMFSDVDNFSNGHLPATASEGGCPAPAVRVRDERGCGFAEALSLARRYFRNYDDLPPVSHMIPSDRLGMLNQSSSATTPLLLVYGVVGSLQTRELLQFIEKASIPFIFRHHPLSTKLVAQGQTQGSDADIEVPVSSAALPIQGYGVSLDIKNMEYHTINQDNAAVVEDAKSRGVTIIKGVNITRLSARFGNNPLRATRKLLEETATASNPTVASSEVYKSYHDLYAVGPQIIHHIKSTEDPLRRLLDVTGNLPLRLSEVLNVSHAALETTNDAVKLLHSTGGVYKGYNKLLVNGRPVEAHEQNIHYVLDQLNSHDVFLTQLLEALKLSPQMELPDRAGTRVVSALEQCRLPVSGEVAATTTSKGGDQASGTQRFALEKERVTWINDIENDDFYRGQLPALSEVLRYHYHQPRFPRRNVFNMVYIVDLSTDEGNDAIRSMVNSYYRGFSARFGIVALNKAALHGNHDPTAEVPENTATLCMAALTMVPTDSLGELLFGLIQSSRTESAINSLLRRSGVSGSVRDTLQSTTFRAYYASLQNYIYGLGLRRFPVVLFNGRPLYSIDRALFNGFDFEFPNLREWVRNGRLTDDVEDIYGWILKETKAVSRYQALVYDEPTYVAIGGAAAEVNSLFFPLPQSLTGASDTLFGTQGSTVTVNDKLSTTSTYRNVFLFSKQYNLDVVHLTHVLLLNASMGKADLSALNTLVKHLSDCGSKCVNVMAKVVFEAPGDDAVTPPAAALSAVLAATETLREEKRIEVIAAALEGTTVHTTAEEIYKKALAVNSKLKPHLHRVEQQEASFFIGKSIVSSSIVRRAVAPYTNGPVLITNGRVIELDETFVSEDYDSLEAMETPKAAAVRACLDMGEVHTLYNNVIDSEYIGAEFIAGKVFGTASVMFHNAMNSGTRELPEDPPAALSFSVGEDHRTARHHIYAVVVPTSREGQRIVSLVKLLTESIDVHVTVVLNIPEENAELPLSLYRYVFDTTLRFSPEDGSLLPPNAYFANLPGNIVFTMGTDEPEAWMVFADKAKEDLDNIHLGSLVAADMAQGRAGSTLEVEYGLHSILVTGTTIDVYQRFAPKSLPLVLQGVHDDLASKADTIVMSNYGYTQLRAAFGLWKISIQPGHHDLDYEVVDVITKDTSIYARPITVRRPEEQRTNTVFVSSFCGTFINLQVSSDVSTDHRASRLQRKKRAEEANTKAAKTKPTLNIFSVASGHLYERFLRLMMYTAVKASSQQPNDAKVKFWLIENFLSPLFKLQLPRYAAEFGFEYQLISYRWPHWLRRQSQKQRTIWGYKILFLDVLFPLDLEKVIFVDADQIVRSDLHELYNMDLQGKPMAYTPFCQKNANPVTKGFRFWDSGFWVEHLQGRPYHISAIYVVDLAQLRRMYGGDQYRMVYDNLSVDPNSLANLDQDLPNYVQAQVPIYSLPEEWLWCETWCSAESKAAAKTIDLCNNPMTKIPKLENAKRIVPDWTEMDTMLQKVVTKNRA